MLKRVNLPTGPAGRVVAAAFRLVETLSACNADCARLLAGAGALGAFGTLVEVSERVARRPEHVAADTLAGDPLPGGLICFPVLIRIGRADIKRPSQNHRDGQADDDRDAGGCEHEWWQLQGLDEEIHDLQDDEGRPRPCRQALHGPRAVS